MDWVFFFASLCFLASPYIGMLPTLVSLSLSHGVSFTQQRRTTSGYYCLSLPIG